MAKTLDEYTPAERARMVGMWCELSEEWTAVKGGEYTWILRSSSNYRGAENVKLFRADSGIDDLVPFKYVTPRFDLPRAWNPDGKPVEMDVETVVAQPHPRGSWNNDSSNPHYFAVEPGTTMRRWVGDWEVQP